MEISGKDNTETKTIYVFVLSMNHVRMVIHVRARDIEHLDKGQKRGQEHIVMTSR
jgi:hypothetical protein